MTKTENFRRFWNEIDRFLGCRYISLASRSWSEFITAKFPVLKFFRHRVDASSNFATVKIFTVFKMCRHRVNAAISFPSRSCFPEGRGGPQKCSFQVIRCRTERMRSLWRLAKVLKLISLCNLFPLTKELCRRLNAIDDLMRFYMQKSWCSFRFPTKAKNSLVGMKCCKS